MAQKQSSCFESGLAPSFPGDALRCAHPDRRDRFGFGWPTPKQSKSRGFAPSRALGLAAASYSERVGPAGQFNLDVFGQRC